MYRFIKCKIIYSLINPIQIIKEFIFSEYEVSSSIKTSYLRNLFSSIVKNGDIAIAGIIVTKIPANNFPTSSIGNHVYSFASLINLGVNDQLK